MHLAAPWEHPKTVALEGILPQLHGELWASIAEVLNDGRVFYFFWTQKKLTL